LEVSVDVEVLDVELEMEFFDIPVLLDLVPVERSDKILPVVLVGRDRDVERMA
jgi:hypothetical protein